MKGIILKRRDNCGIVKHVYQNCLNLILEKDINDAVKFLNNVLEDILYNHKSLLNLCLNKYRNNKINTEITK